MLAMQAHSAESKYIKAVTYFGAAWPINYWNSNVNRADADFREIREDGFNAVILVVPWGEFQPGLEPIQYNDDAYARLTKVCQAAKSQRLQVYMRVSYLWDMYPGAQMPNIERMNSLLSNDTRMPAWQQYLDRIGAATRDCANGSFISWEDFWHLIPLAESAKTEKDSAALSRQIGFDAWIRIHADRDFLKKYAAVEKRYGAYPVPDRKSPDFRFVFMWFDDQLMSRLMPALAKRLPNASIEARVDDDPLYDGERLVSWYSHKQTYKVQSSPFVMTYWAPAMGAENHGEIETANKVLERFTYMQKKVANDTGNKIFIGQFLFKDNTPAMAMNAAIMPDQVSAFIRNIAGPMVGLTAGYSLWGARNYDASTLFNGFFSLGDLGWKFSSGAAVVKSGNDFFTRLPRGASITQSISVMRDPYRRFAKSMTLRFRATGPGTITASYVGTTHSIRIGAGSGLFKLAFPVPPPGSDSVLQIACTSGVVRLTDLVLFDHTQISDVRDSLGKPLRHLADIRALNKMIDEVGGLSNTR